MEVIVVCMNFFFFFYLADREKNIIKFRKNNLLKGCYENRNRERTRIGGNETRIRVSFVLCYQINK